MKALSRESRYRIWEVHSEFMGTGHPNGWFHTDPEVNFRKLAAIELLAKTPLKGSSVLDVGCGTGEFSRLLRKKGVAHYLGIDMYGYAITTARFNNPQENFMEAEFLEAKIDRTFDYAFASGTLSLFLPGDDNYKFIEAMIAKMWALTDTGIAFNYYEFNDIAVEYKVFHYKPEKVEKICRKVSGGAKYADEKNTDSCLADQVVTVFLFR